MCLYKQGARKVIFKACHLGKPMGGSRGRVQGKRTPPPPEMTCGFLIQLVFCKKKPVVYWCWQETSAPPPKKNPRSAPEAKANIILY